MKDLAALIVVLILTAVGAGWGGYTYGVSVEKSKNQAALLLAEQENAEETARRVLAVKTVAANLEREKDELENNLAGATDALGLMREAVRRANTGSDSTTPDGINAARARTLLAECSERYLNMARTADELRTTVLALQQYVTITLNGE